MGDNKGGKPVGGRTPSSSGSDLPEQVDAATWETWLAKKMGSLQRSAQKDAWDLTGAARVKDWELFSPDWAYIAEHDSMALRGLVALSVGMHPAFADENWVFQVALPYFQGEREDIELPFAEDSAERCAEAVRQLDTFLRRVSVGAAGVSAGTLPTLGTSSDGQALVRCQDFASFAAAKGWSLPAAFPWDAPVDAGKAATAPTLKRPVETPEQRQDRRIGACEAAGLEFDPGDPDQEGYRLPRGVGALAKAEGISRAAFAEDVRAGLQRRYRARRAGWAPQGR